METNQANSDTLIAGRSVTVLFDDGTSETVTIQQLALRKYEDAYRKLDDEIDLVAFMCGKAKQWIHGTPPEFKNAMQPNSYEFLITAMREVNANGFFAYSQRRWEAMAQRASVLNPRVMQAAAEKMSNATSSTPSPRLQPR